MKLLLAVLLCTGSFLSGCKQTTPSANDLESTLEKFRTVLITPTQDALAALVSDSLSYGHSSGKIENKEQFITTLITGVSNFLSITITDQKISLLKNIAIVRHNMEAAIHDKDKDPMTIHLHILMVWQNINGEWILHTRQAVKR